MVIRSNRAGCALIEKVAKKISTKDVKNNFM